MMSKQKKLLIMMYHHGIALSYQSEMRSILRDFQGLHMMKSVIEIEIEMIDTDLRDMMKK